MADSNVARDLIYLDQAKCESLFGVSGPAQQTLASLEQRVGASSSTVDVNAAADANLADAKPIHDKLKGATFLRVTGYAGLEDYDRFKHMADNSNPMIEFIGRCTVHAVEQSADYQKAQTELDNARTLMKKEVDRKKKESMEQRIKGLETRFRNLIAQQTQMQGIPDWMVSGFVLFIDSFLSGRVTFRVYPFEQVPEFQVVGNLKRDAFLNSSVEHFIATYGSRPYVKMTMLGLLTSLPEPTGHPFNPMAQFQRLQEQKQDVKLEHGFRQFYNALEMLEGLIGFGRYPNAVVHPLAIYRDIK